MLNGEKLIEAINQIKGYMTLIRMAETDDVMRKHYNFEGILVLKPLSCDKDEEVKVIKHLQSMDLLDDEYNVKKDYLLNEDLARFLNEIYFNDPYDKLIRFIPKKEAFKTNIRTKYSGKWYTIFRQTNGRFVMAESKYVDCLTNVIWKTKDSDKGNMIFAIDKDNEEEIIAGLRCYKFIDTGYARGNEEITIEQYLDENGYETVN